MENDNNTAQIEIISGKEMLRRIIEEQKGEEKRSKRHLSKIAELSKLVSSCKYIDEADELEKKILLKISNLNKYIEYITLAPEEYLSHAQTYINTTYYKTNIHHPEQLASLLGERIKLFRLLHDKLRDLIIENKLQERSPVQSLELSNLSYDYIKNLYEYLADKAIIKNEGEITRESLDYAITGRKPKENWSYTPITLLASKQELRFILSYLINGNQLGPLSNEVKRRAGNLFIKDGAPIGELSNLSKKVKEKREAYKGIDHHREFFQKCPSDLFGLDIK